MTHIQILVDNNKLMWLGDQNYPLIASLGTTLEEMEWNERFESLLNFSDEFGHCNVPFQREYPLPSGTIIRLGKWLEAQRKALKENTLNSHKEGRFQMLISSGKLRWQITKSPVAGSSSTLKESWITAFQALIRYGEEYGTCNVPLMTDYMLGDGTDLRLGRWLDKQRQRQRNKTLCDEKETVLQTLVDDGRLKWRLSGTSASDDSRWIEHYDAFIRHGQETSTYNLKKNFKIVDHNFDSGESVVLSIGLWLNTQREYKIKEKLKPERERLLQALVDEGKLFWKPIRSDRKDDGRWGLHFDALVRYGEEHGHCNVPQPSEYPLKDENGTNSTCKLGFWVSKQRKNQKNGSLLPDREEQLQGLVDGGMFKWNIRFTSE
jgi:hypothetical protein